MLVFLVATVFLWLALSMMLGANDPASSPAVDDPFVVVLGIAQDAGFPQAGCAKSCCQEAWADHAARRHVACLAIVDPKTHERWIIDATPDFREQLRALDAIEPPTTAPGLAGILLTHGHIGHYTGLMFLGHESIGAKNVRVHVMPRIARFLATNGPWDQLVRYGNIELRPIVANDGSETKDAGEAIDAPGANDAKLATVTSESKHVIELNDRITVTAFRVPHREEYTEVVGFRIDGPRRSVVYIPDIDKWNRWERRIEDVVSGVDVAYLDGTFYANGEIPGRDMSAIPHPFIVESMHRFETEPAAERAKIRFIHLNHTNPALDPDGEARRAIRAAGFRVADEGERVGL